MTFFAATAYWLQSISGQNPNHQVVDKKSVSIDHIQRDYHAMKDAETKDGVHTLPLPSRHGGGRGSRGRNAARRSGGVRMHHQQPMPKSVAHKEPTRGKKKKEKAKSNRLGKSYMA